MYDVEQELRSALHAAAPEGRSVPFDPIARRARTRRTLRTATAAGVSALAVAAVAVTAAGLGPSGTSAPPVAGRSTGTPATSQSTGQAVGDCVRGIDPTKVAVDYIDFIRMYGHEYLAVDDAVGAGKVGPIVGTVRCTFSVTYPGPKHVPQDGDAAFLPVGTEIHELEGYPPSVRLVVKSPDDGWVVYEVPDPGR